MGGRTRAAEATTAEYAKHAERRAASLRILRLPRSAPETVQQEVLDFLVFLKTKETVRREGRENSSVHVGKGVFAPWTDYGFFRQASIGERGRTLTWPGELDFCADALWLQVTGKKPEDLFPNLRQERAAYADS